MSVFIWYLSFPSYFLVTTRRRLVVWLHAKCHTAGLRVAKQFHVLSAQLKLLKTVSAMQQSCNKYILMTLHKPAEPSSCSCELYKLWIRGEADFCFGLSLNSVILCFSRIEFN